jgi:hypothetical protein
MRSALALRAVCLMLAAGGSSRMGPAPPEAGRATVLYELEVASGESSGEPPAAQIAGRHPAGLRGSGGSASRPAIRPCHPPVPAQGATSGWAG